MIDELMQVAPIWNTTHEQKAKFHVRPRNLTGRLPDSDRKKPVSNAVLSTPVHDKVVHPKCTRM